MEVKSAISAGRVTRPVRKRVGIAAVLLLAATLTACGGSTDDSSNGTANGTDRAFASEMVDHHELAIEMAETAQERATRPEIKQLADDIVATQQSEIDQMEAADQRLADQGVEAASLEMSDSMMGMDMNHSGLMGAKEFDRAFIDSMIPHHRGAIRMARIELKVGDDPELRQLAKATIAAQTKEIRTMNAWRLEWYGEPSPAGGAPGMEGHMGMHD